MNDISTANSLAAAFPPADEAQWRRLVAKVLKDAPFERLTARTQDGIVIQPLYPRPAHESPRALRAAAGPWSIVARIDHPDATAANAQALTDLANGATGLSLVFADAPAAHGFGISDASPETLDRLFAEIHLDAGLTLVIEAGKNAPAIAAHIAQSKAARGIAPGASTICAGIDPLGLAALRGGDPAGSAARAAGAALDLVRAGLTGPLVAADGRMVHAAGGSEAQELAFALGAALAYLRALEAAGAPLEQARDLIGFRLAVDADAFLSIARLRALRLLWARIEAACGIAPKPVHIHAETAWRMATRRDPYVNLLRSAMATFAASLGGADSLTVLPFTQAAGLPDAFARRLARNTQIVLLEESHLDAVADPAAGAGGFEALTGALCKEAWGLLQASEAAGGLAASLARGDIQTAVAKVRAARLKQVVERRTPLTGTSEFPFIDEAPATVLAARSLAEERAQSEGALGPMRLAQAFEALREDAEILAGSHGKRPEVFLASLGSPAAFTARAGFAKNLFEAGGIVAPGNEGFESDADLVAAFRSSGATLACICSSDAIYADRAEAAARALKAAGARHIWLAGRPGDNRSALEAAGITGFAYAGCDAVALLRDALAKAA